MRMSCLLFFCIVFCSCNKLKQSSVYETNDKKDTPESAENTSISTTDDVEESSKNLVNFIINSTIVEPESDLVLKLTSAEKVQSHHLVFKIYQDGSVCQVLDDESELALTDEEGKLSKKEINRLVEEKRKSDEEDFTVNIEASMKVKAQKVVDLLGILAEHNISKVSFTNEESE